MSLPGSRSRRMGRQPCPGSTGFRLPSLACGLICVIDPGGFPSIFSNHRTGRFSERGYIVDQNVDIANDAFEVDQNNNIISMINNGFYIADNDFRFIGYNRVHDYNVESCTFDLFRLNDHIQAGVQPLFKIPVESSNTEVSPVIRPVDNNKTGKP